MSVKQPQSPVHLQPARVVSGELIRFNREAITQLDATYHANILGEPSHLISPVLYLNAMSKLFLLLHEVDSPLSPHLSRGRAIYCHRKDGGSLCDSLHCTNRHQRRGSTGAAYLTQAHALRQRSRMLAAGQQSNEELRAHTRKGSLACAREHGT